MKIKTKMMKALAVTMSATMVMGMTTTAFATPDVTVDAPIYSFDVENVIVPTTFAVAFNPDELTVTVGTAATSTDQVLSKIMVFLIRATRTRS